MSTANVGRTKGSARLSKRRCAGAATVPTDAEGFPTADTSLGHQPFVVEEQPDRFDEGASQYQPESLTSLHRDRELPLSTRTYAAERRPGRAAGAG